MPNSGEIFPVDTIICGDCLTVMRDIPSGSVDMVFTDPPYGHNNNGTDLIGRRELALGEKNKPPQPPRPIANDGVEATDLLINMLDELKRIVKKNGVICVCCSGGGGVSPQFARWSAIIDKRFTFKQAVVWDKGKMGMGWHYRRSYEFVLVAVNGNGSGNWYDDSHIVENIIRPGDYGIRKIIPSATQHPTEKPVELAGHFIKLHSKEGDVILDPFCGHGSTLEAAVRKGRSYIGIDLSQDYCDIAERRVLSARQQLTLNL